MMISSVFVLFNAHCLFITVACYAELLLGNKSIITIEYTGADPGGGGFGG